jgi:hypothetical protein
VGERRRHRRAWYLLLLAPFIGLLWPAWYATKAPKLFGFPFFYWYQFVWVVGAALITAIVWLAVRPRPPSARARRFVRTEAGGGPPGEGAPLEREGRETVR